MKWTLVFLFGLIALVFSACDQEWFPSCKDPKHPCPPVQPDYPPSPPFGAARDAGDGG